MKKTYILSPLISLCFFQCSGRSEEGEGNRGQEKGRGDEFMGVCAGFAKSSAAVIPSGEIY
jgi:hypothetical protein